MLKAIGTRKCPTCQSGVVLTGLRHGLSKTEGYLLSDAECSVCKTQLIAWLWPINNTIANLSYRSTCEAEPEPADVPTGIKVWRVVTKNGHEIHRSPLEAKVMELTFEKLRTVSILRSSRWYVGGINDWSLSDWGVAFAGEAGEVCDAIKKLNRARDGIPGNKVPVRELKRALADEIADAMIYLDLLAARADINLEYAVRKKFNEVSEKLGFPERL